MAVRKKSKRSDYVRTRRTGASKATKRAPVQVSDTGSQRTQPPVVMRGGFTPMARPKMKKGKSRGPKRRYDIALPTPGVEIQLPAIPRVRLGWQVVSFALSIGLFALLYYLWTAPVYQVQAAEIHGLTYLPPSHVAQWLNIRDQSVFSLDAAQIEDDLRIAFPGLLDVSVEVGLPASLVITATERTPVVAWIQDGEEIWIDGEGNSFKPLGEDESLIRVKANGAPPPPIIVEDEEDSTSEEDVDETALPPVNPLEELGSPKPFMRPELISAILTLHAQAPTQAKIIYDADHGLGWEDRRGFSVYLGRDGAEIGQKLAVFRGIWLYLKDQGLTPTIISVEYLHAPYYRLEP